MTESPDFWLQPVREEFEKCKKLAEAALAQVHDNEFFASASADTNSVAALVKHVGNNLRSRWTDFLTTDGEKPDRNRDGEFDPSESRADIVEIWNQGWRAVSKAFSELTAANIGQTITIRNEPHTIPLALIRSLAHTSQHVGQIILLAHQFRGTEWKTLSIPRGASEAYIEKMRQQFKG